MSLATVLAEDQRLVILRTLSEVSGYALNEQVLHRALAAVGHNVTHDVVRGHLQFLKDAGLVRIEDLAMPSGVLWLAHLMTRGQDVASGAHFPGVARLPAE
jgi:DNA-binding transcriptional ArsR family regulator